MPTPIRITAFLYPQFHSDWQPLVAPLLTQLPTSTFVQEALFPDRLRHWEELAKMGARFAYEFGIETRFNDMNPHAATITGPVALKGAEVTARDLRTGACLVTAALIAKGTTCIHRAEEIDRGYEDMVATLRSLGVSAYRED